MEKKRWSLILMALCLMVAFSVSPVEAGSEKGQKKCNDDQDNDGDGLTDGDDPDCGGTDPGEPVGPKIGLVANKFGGGSAAAFITEALDGIYSKVSLKNFNNRDAQWLRDRFEVLHIQWSSPSSMQVSRSKLEDFMALGGGILHEDPQNVLEIVELNGVVVEHHVPGDDVAIVEFVNPSPTGYVSHEEILSAFVPGQDAENQLGYFQPVPSFMSEAFCLDPANGGSAEINQTLGLGYGCLVNNHMTFDAVQDILGLTPFLHLEGDPTAVVGLYGEFNGPGPPDLTGRILFTGPDSAVHASMPASPLQANHFCLLTNELIWLSQLDPAANPAKAAMEDCVENAKEYRMDQGQPED